MRKGICEELPNASTTQGVRANDNAAHKAKQSESMRGDIGERTYTKSAHAHALYEIRVRSVVAQVGMHRYEICAHIPKQFRHRFAIGQARLNCAAQAQRLTGTCAPHLAWSP